MTTPDTAKSAGLLESALQKLFTRDARIIHIEDVTPHFRLLTLRGDALRQVDWHPGDKIQVQFGGWVQRTYTPMDWDAAEGRTRILVYLHGDAPGTRWAGSLKAGDRCRFMGPRKSVRLAQPASVLLFGDETSIGLAAALSLQAPVQLLCEPPVCDAAAMVIHRLSLRRVTPGKAEQMATLARNDPSTDIVLTGRASAIQQMSRTLREAGIASGRRQSKAYWADGKTGLD